MMDIEAYNRTREVPSASLVCHAPFVSLHFDPLGNAYACDSSYRHVLGRYPERSLREIWFGEPIRQMRRWIGDLDLSHSCQRCQDQLTAGNYYCVRARDYDWLEPIENAAEAMPQVLEFDLSNVCNLGCVMCNGYSSSWIRRHREKLPALHSPYDEIFVDQLEEFLPHLKMASFVGGEPFLSPIYYQIWEMIARLKPQQNINITTNGTVWNKRVQTLLDQLSCAITVSIDSLQEETYEKIRVNSSFKKVMENLEHMSTYCRSAGTTIRMSVCPMRSNWRELPDILRFCNDRNMHLIFNNVLHPAEHTLRTLNSDDLNGIVDYLQSAFGEVEAGCVKENLERYRSLVSQIVAWRDDAESRQKVMTENVDAVHFSELRQNEQETAEEPVRSALLDWVSGLVNPAGDENEPTASLQPRLRDALEDESVKVFVHQYFKALGEIGPVLHADATSMPHIAKAVGAIVADHEQRDWFVEQLIRWDPDHVLTALKAVPRDDIEAWVDEQFAIAGRGR